MLAVSPSPIESHLVHEYKGKPLVGKRIVSPDTNLSSGFGLQNGCRVAAHKCRYVRLISSVGVRLRDQSALVSMMMSRPLSGW